MPSRRSSQPDLPDAAYSDTLRLWTLRLLLSDLSKEPLDRRVSGLCGLLGLAKGSLDDTTPAKARALLQKMLDRDERAGIRLPEQTVIARNLHALGERLGLSPVECDVVHFTTLQRLVTEFDSALDTCGRLTRAALVRMFSICLGHSVADVRTAVDDDGALARSSLLWVDANASFMFSGKVETLDGLADDLTVEHDDLISLIRRSVTRAQPPGLRLEDYPHLASDIDIVRSYLRQAGASQTRGVNVMLHGRPGTGKTELVRALVADIGGELLEIPVEEPGGRPRVGHKRFDSYRFAQSMLAKSAGVVLLFDEVEDVFCDDPRTVSGDGNSSGFKGWVNRMLENNPVPTFWVTNHLDSIDPAYRRRFDLVLEVGVPPASVRRRILSHWTGDLPVDDRWRDAAARHPDLVPAIVGRAARVGNLLLQADPQVSVDQVLTRVVNNTLDALGSRPIDHAGQGAVGDGRDYRLELLNPDVDLAQLRQGLREVGAGRLLLSGPPGSGKSAFGRHLADHLDRPLLVRRASDILSPYVGQTERRIAAMFAEARDEGAVLLFDEVDSLLQDRRGAVRSWEVTQVNEMLTGMETFEGIFIASTNLAEGLDAAAARRFDAHVKLGYLRPEQAWQLLSELATDLALTVDAATLAGVERLDRLAPGDFAALRRMCRLSRPATANGLLDRLRRMHADKSDGQRRAIGFAA